MGVHQYFKRLSDMERLIRLPGKFKYFEHNVAAHSFKVTKIAQYLATVEEEMVETFIEEEIPLQYRDVYKQRLQEGKDDSLEGQILSVADKIDLLYETFGEIQKRNPEELFFEIYEMSLETIIQFDHLASVQDFINNIIPEMLTENFIPRTELRETTMNILNKRKEENE